MERLADAGKKTVFRVERREHHHPIGAVPQRVVVRQSSEHRSRKQHRSEHHEPSLFGEREHPPRASEETGKEDTNVGDVVLVVARHERELEPRLLGQEHGRSEHHDDRGAGGAHGGKGQSRKRDAQEQRDVGDEARGAAVVQVVTGFSEPS